MSFHSLHPARTSPAALPLPGASLSSLARIAVGFVGAVSAPIAA